MKVGEWVLAIGSPFQLSQTVTAGIVSATGRTNVGFADYEDFIQTDAAINPGNSGGALVNSRGELVGINTGIFSESGGYQGIGFAVPSNLARRIVGDLMKYGEVRRGSVGFLRVERLTDQIAEEVGAPNTTRRGRLADDARLGKLRGRPAARRRHRGIQQAGVDDPSQFFRLVADAKSRIDGADQGAAQRPRDGVQAADRLELGVVRQRAPLTGRPTTLHCFQ